MSRRGAVLSSLFLLLASSASWAGGMHAGVPVSGIQGLGEPSFVSPAVGWTAPVLQDGGGMVRVFVAPTEDAAIAWYNGMLQRGLTTPPSEAARLPGLDAAHGDGVGLWLFRDGNVVALVRAEHDARAIGERLRAAVVDQAPAPAQAAVLTEIAPGRWRVDGDDVVHVQFVGGALLPTRTGWTFTALPTGMVVWDSLGRAVTWGDWQD